MSLGLRRAVRDECRRHGAEPDRRSSLPSHVRRHRARAEHQKLAARLAYVERLLADLGVPAGESDRAESLGIPPYARRGVCAFVAQAHERAVEIPDLFITWTELRRLGNARRLARVQRRSPKLGSYLGGLGEGHRDTVLEVAKGIRRRLDGPERGKFLKVDADIVLAVEFLRGDQPRMDDWLRACDVAQALVDHGVREDLAEEAAVRLTAPRTPREDDAE
ncbi:MAG: hypothetical protein ACQEXJ_25060 [Myxococcota bacterium]